MPYPKGINDPAVRERFLTERRATLAEFDRLCAGGMQAYRAAEQVGFSAAGIKSMRRSLENLTERGHEWQAGGSKGGERIDLGLALLGVLRKPGETLTLDDIAPWCGCSRSALWAIEQSAMRKVRQRLLKSVAGTDLAEEVEALFGGKIAAPA